MNKTTKPKRKFSLSATDITFASAAIFIVLLVLLHFLEPEFDPSWRFISEYELGNYGWIMQSAFIILAISHIALFWEIRSYLKDIGGRIGLSLLLVNIAGLLLAGIFITDSVMTSPDAVTASGKLHNLGGTLGIAGLISTLIISWKLYHNQAWFAARKPVLWATLLVILGFCVSAFSIVFMVSQSKGIFGPDVLVGWPNRFGILTACVWLMVISRQASQIRT